MRRVAAIFFGLTLGVVLFAGSSGAGELRSESITVRKVVTGPAPSGFTVNVSCPDGGLEANLEFDATGAPTTTDNPAFVIQGGAWVSSRDQNTQTPFSCSVTETGSPEAVSTTWTCDYEFTTLDGQEPGGCAAASGTDQGPATIDYTNDTSITTQNGTVTFTNTFAVPEPVVVAPAFTG